MIERLHFITQQNDRFTHLSGMEAALDAGVRWVQLRIKDQPASEIEKQAVEARLLCDRYQAKLIINDHVGIAKAVNADGVHLGKDDMPVETARMMLGEGKIIGATANTIEDIMAHAGTSADYIGLGPFRFTTTKKKLSPILGIEGFQSTLCQCDDHHIALPIIAIGGIDIMDIPALLRAGVYGIAASSLILGHLDISNTVKTIFGIMNTKRKSC